MGHRLAGRRGRAAAALTTTLLAATVLAGCTEQVAGRPGPAPRVSAGGDFSSSATGTSSPTGSDEPTTDETTDEPTGGSSGSTPEPTDTSTDVETTQQLCTDFGYVIDNFSDVGAETVKSYVSILIYAWGYDNGDPSGDPFDTVDAATTAACPDQRTGVLALTQTPDLKSTK